MILFLMATMMEEFLFLKDISFVVDHVALMMIK
jgi:hypothetical protein